MRGRPPQLALTALASPPSFPSPPPLPSLSPHLAPSPVLSRPLFTLLTHMTLMFGSPSSVFPLSPLAQVSPSQAFSQLPPLTLIVLASPALPSSSLSPHTLLFPLHSHFLSSFPSSPSPSAFTFSILPSIFPFFPSLSLRLLQFPLSSYTLKYHPSSS